MPQLLGCSNDFLADIEKCVEYRSSLITCNCDKTVLITVAALLMAEGSVMLVLLS